MGEKNSTVRSFMQIDMVKISRGQQNYLPGAPFIHNKFA